MKRFSIIIPLYNEEASVRQVVADIERCLPKNIYDYEIILVDDCSTDRTGQIIEQLDNVRVIHHSRKQGYGASIKMGITQSNEEYILIIDGDGTYPADAIPEMLKYAESYDMVSGHRHGNNLDHRWLYSQKIGKFILKSIAGYVTGIKIPDINCGLRIFKKEIIQKFWDFYPDGFSFTTTSLVAFLANGYSVRFVPIDYHKRKGKSTLKPLQSFMNFVNLILKISLFFKPIRVFLPISALLLSAALGITVYGLVWRGVFFDTTLILLSAAAFQTFFFGLLAEITVRSRK